jgi:hypothetical protein
MYDHIRFSIFVRKNYQIVNLRTFFSEAMYDFHKDF